MNKKINKILLTLTTFFIMANNVFGETQNTYLTEMKDSNGQTIYRNYNGKQDRQISIAIGANSSTTINGYCIDVGADLGDKAPISQLDSNLEEYLKKALNNEEKAKKVAKKINQYIHFGYQYNGQNSDKYLIATQKLIWDELYNAGYRQDQYASDLYFTAGGQTYDVSAEENTIKKNIANYYKTPSQCSSTSKLELAVGETATYEDTEGVLSSYTVTCDSNLTCKKEGNKLIITANAEATEQNITFTKNGISGNGTIIYQRSGEQAVLVNNGPIEGISCKFGVDTYKNVQTSEPNFIITITLAIISVIVAYTILLKTQKLNA